MRSVRTSGSAFSWMVSEAEVWRQNRVRSPSVTPLPATKSAAASVISVNPGPGVWTVNRPSA
jgi:hypothetical protein